MQRPSSYLDPCASQPGQGGGGAVLLSHASAPACQKQLAWAGRDPSPVRRVGAGTLAWHPVRQETPEAFLEEAAL